MACCKTAHLITAKISPSSLEVLTIQGIGMRLRGVITFESSSHNCVCIKKMSHICVIDANFSDEA